MCRPLPLPPALRCIAVASSLGAPMRGAEAGPAALFAAGLLTHLRERGLPCRKARALRPRETAGSPLGELLERLAERCASAVQAGERPLVLGGDHAIAAGTWKGIGRALGAAPGLLWIDAHLDAHTPASSLSGNAHGMPLAALLGEGTAPLATVAGPRLDPRRVAVLGARSWEPAERARLERLGVRIHGMDEIARRGFTAVFNEALAGIGTGRWGLSLDIDALDPDAAPGVSTPAPGGLAPAGVLPALRGLLRHPDCVGVELVEFNPARDADGRTARLALDLLDALAAPCLATLPESAAPEKSAIPGLAA